MKVVLPQINFIRGFCVNLGREHDTTALRAHAEILPSLVQASDAGAISAVAAARPYLRDAERVELALAARVPQARSARRPEPTPHYLWEQAASGQNR